VETVRVDPTLRDARVSQEVGESPRANQNWTKELNMIDWSEGHTKLKELIKELYEAMLWNQTGKAQEICEQIVVEARVTRALIKSKEVSP
jgi:hypothetical protein